MSHRLRPQDGVPSLNEIIHSAVNLARICLNMDVAFITEFKDGRRIFRHIATVEEFVPIKAGDSHPLEESYCQYVVDGQIPPIVDDSHIYPILQALSATEAMKIRAHLGVPIRLSDGSVFGTFCCYSRSPASHLREVDVEAMARFADLIACMLEQRVLAERAHETASARLSALIAARGMHMVYQPIVDIATRRAVGLEALARFRPEPLRGPDKWFAEAHALARGAELELLAIEHALADLARLAPGAYLALNVSPHTILSGKLEAALAGAPPERLVLEMTEHAPIEEYDSLARVLARLRAAGLKLAIDDAGSGYASFRHILQLCPDIIKLDQSLIRDIDLDPGRRALALALITFAGETGSTIVAEGVETERELAVLRSLGVDLAQGYLLGRPAPAPALAGC
ncbi:EAL domain-containing protein [Massilia sp. Leaf139]|uniref:sensor domain-containing phosphodiesterase n=1 Tax=Massilia sp. Leaf139 TaxID=1736272 RepID=UPI0006FB8067|nr:EAL domain-containing protein [Massilia sp. Leaf139]KQQ96504.1 diguanylate phosphodiesterase [Massilia sp. Leaf139]